jgi:porin
MRKPSNLIPALAAMALLSPLVAASGHAQDGLFTQKLLETAPASLEDGIKSLGDKGALFQFNYTGEAFANFSGGVRRGGDYEGLLKISLNLDLQKLVQWNGATLYASMIYPHGNGITARYVNDYDILSSIDAYDSIRLFELWLQQTFFDGKFSIRAGQLTTDNDFFVSTNSDLFINSAFGTIGTVDHDVIPPIYPVGSEGIRLHYDINPSLYVQVMAADDNPGAQNYDDKHGTQFGINRSHGVLSFFEAGYTAASSGSYKLGGFFDSQFHPDISSQSSAHCDYGFYAVVDQPLYVAPGSTKDSPQGLGAFARISYAPDQRNAVVYYFDTGFNYTGLLPGRPKDIFGAAFSFERLGTDLTPEAGAPVLSHHEHVVELTYLANLSDWFSLQPDFQYIINPGGIGKTPNAFVAGLRFNVTF